MGMKRVAISNIFIPPFVLIVKLSWKQFSNERYTKNECWINSEDFYGDTLLSDSRKRKVMTRQKLLNILNKTEETVYHSLNCITLIFESLMFLERWFVDMTVPTKTNIITKACIAWLRAVMFTHWTMTWNHLNRNWMSNPSFALKHIPSS